MNVCLFFLFSAGDAPLCSTQREQDVLIVQIVQSECVCLWVCEIVLATEKNDSREVAGREKIDLYVHIQYVL